MSTRTSYQKPQLLGVATRSIYLHTLCPPTPRKSDLKLEQRVGNE
jgi:hypothetical protein